MRMVNRPLLHLFLVRIKDPMFWQEKAPRIKKIPVVPSRTTGATTGKKIITLPVYLLGRVNRTPNITIIANVLLNFTFSFHTHTLADFEDV